MYRELCATDLFGVFGFGAFRPRIGVFLWTALPSNPVPSTFGVFLWMAPSSNSVPSTYWGVLWTTPPSNPVPSTLGAVLWTTPPSNPVPSTFGAVLWTEKMKRLCSFAHQTVLVNVRLLKFTRTTKRRTIVIHVASSGEPWTYKVHWNCSFFQIPARSLARMYVARALCQSECLFRPHRDEVPKIPDHVGDDKKQVL